MYQKLTRTHKSCPDCDNHNLFIAKHHDVELDQCLRCRGLWFERNEVSQLQANVDGKPFEEGFEQFLGAHLGHSQRACPECGIALQRHHLMDEFTVEIDYCRSCSGTWLDRHELTEVAHSNQVRQALGELNRSISWKTWLFQFLSQMPVEYNLAPHRTPWVTRGLLIINVMLFALLWFLLPISEPIFQRFGLLPEALSQGQQWWGLLTHMFLHGGWLHLLGNMYLLYVIGDNLEDVLGHRRFLLFYVICGVAGGLAHYVSNIDSNVLMVGASGAIAGLFGMYLLWFRHASLTFMFIVYQKKLPAWGFFMIWALINILGIVSGQQGIAYWAHLGGLLAGLVLGVIYRQEILAKNLMLVLLSNSQVRIKR